MEPIINNIPGSKVEIKFTVTAEEAKPYLDEAVKEISLATSIPGFRPGKAPYAEVVKAVGGEMKVWQAALEKIVRASYVRTVLEQKLETVGSPEVAVDQLIPGQELKFTCTSAVMPKMNKMEQPEKPFVEIKARAVEEKDVEKALEELRKMRRQETVSAEPSKADGMICVDLEMKKDGVLLEGGSAKDYRVYLSEDHYIPGFAGHLVGLKKGEKKNFTVTFPEDHFQKLYAGKDIECSVDVKEVYEVGLPEINDEFAKSLGVENAEALKDLLKKNLTSEEERRALEKAEIELLDTLVKKSSFTEVPEILIKEEVRRMFEELRRDIEGRGGKMEDYLSSLKKSADELRIELVPRAIDRVQTAVYIRQVAKDNNLNPEEKEIDAEIDRLLASVPEDDKDTRAHVSSPEYRDYVATMMRNRRSIEFLKKQGIKDYEQMKEKQAKEEAESGGHQHGPDCNHDHE